MTTISDFGARLERFLTNQAKSPAKVTSLKHLTGGASRDTWAIDLEFGPGTEPARQALIIRRDMGGEIQDEALSRAQEFHILQEAYAAGVLVPRPRWLCTDANVLDAPFFIMDRIEGESVGRRVVREPGLAEARKQLPRQMALQVARIHKLQPGLRAFQTIPAGEPGLSPGESAVTRASRQLAKYAEPHPALELGLRWLQSHVPKCNERVVVHGDFRIGNLIVGPDGLRAVIDWEFCHIGDPAEDLAWPTVRSWRFGQDKQRFGGIADGEEFFATYEQASGRIVDRPAIRFWEILGNFRWAVGCISQADRHLSGQAPNLELASLGRRACEMELEMLSLIEKYDE